MPENSFLKTRIKSIGFALKGAWILLRTEGSIQVQFAIAVLVTIAGWYFEISRTEWMIQILAISTVMGTEAVNTAIEKLSDYVQPDWDPRIGLIKDISAGAVMFCSFLAVITGLFIYIPKVF